MCSVFLQQPLPAGCLLRLIHLFLFSPFRIEHQQPDGRRRPNVQQYLGVAFTDAAAFPLSSALFFTHTRDRVRSSKAANLYCNCRQMLLFFLYASRLERMQPKGRSKPKSETQQMAHRTRTHTYTHTVRNVITIKAQHVV